MFNQYTADCIKQLFDNNRPRRCPLAQDEGGSRISLGLSLPGFCFPGKYLRFVFILIENKTNDLEDYLESFLGRLIWGFCRRWKMFGNSSAKTALRFKLHQPNFWQLSHTLNKKKIHLWCNLRQIQYTFKINNHMGKYFSNILGKYLKKLFQ